MPQSPPDPDPGAFYDALAGEYHLIFADWAASIEHQALALRAVLGAEGFPPPARMLDCACGIGTQTLGLAGAGYRVHATDLSPEAVRRAESEAAAREVVATFAVADMRRLADEVEGPFDVVVCADNSLPHLQSDEDLDAALAGIGSVLRPGGLILATTRDYDAILATNPRPSGDVPRLLETNGPRRLVTQAWTWTDAERYRLDHFMLMEEQGSWRVWHRQAGYRAITRGMLSEHLQRAGFGAVHWRPPEETGFFQPLVTARRAG
ncbi:MAG: methyltransferase domain-containing protein [Acidimicrobiia bacterium]